MFVPFLPNLYLENYRFILIRLIIWKIEICVFEIKSFLEFESNSIFLPNNPIQHHINLFCIFFFYQRLNGLKKKTNFDHTFSWKVLIESQVLLHFIFFCGDYFNSCKINTRIYFNSLILSTTWEYARLLQYSEWEVS